MGYRGADVSEEPQLAAEKRARVLIDRQLNDAGWQVQDRKSLNLFAGPGVAVCEVVMAKGHGRADYLLYVDQHAVGVIEAKPVGSTLSGLRWRRARVGRACGLVAGPSCPPATHLFRCWLRRKLNDHAFVDQRDTRRMAANNPFTPRLQSQFRRFQTGGCTAARRGQPSRAQPGRSAGAAHPNASLLRRVRSGRVGPQRDMILGVIAVPDTAAGSASTASATRLSPGPSSGGAACTVTRRRLPGSALAPRDALTISLPTKENALRGQRRHVSYLAPARKPLTRDRRRVEDRRSCAQPQEPSPCLVSSP